jgi:8-oxo-dGTP diphosphatase
MCGASTHRPRAANGAPWPRCAASAAIFRGEKVLLVERGSGALKGLWSLPGGHIEPGERAVAAAAREVFEEACIRADVLGLLDIHEVLLRDADRLLAHYLIAVFFGRWVAGEPVPGGDAAAARFLELGEVASYPLTDGAASLIVRAKKRLGGGEGT